MAGLTVAEVAAAIRAGGVAIVPTDTVYGLAAAPDAAAEIFELKKRPASKALPVLGTGPAQLRAVAQLDEVALALAEKAWPGPLTLVVPRAGGFTADLGGSDTSTIAVRVPAHPLALELLALSGPLAVTSANRSGDPPATTAHAARALFPDAVLLDGGTCDGSPSTVVSITGEAQVLREGELPGADVLGWVRDLRTGS